MSKQAKKYSAAEKKAYYMGLGAAIGFGRLKEIKKARSKMSVAEKESFGNGFDAYLFAKVRGNAGKRP